MDESRMPKQMLSARCKMERPPMGSRQLPIRHGYITTLENIGLESKSGELKGSSSCFKETDEEHGGTTMEFLLEDYQQAAL
jgi:hypothetical protein